MRTFSKSCGRTALCLVSILAASSLGRAATDNQNEELLVKSTQGKVVYSTDNKTWMALKSDQALPQGAVLRTEGNGSADVMLKFSGAVLRLGPNTEIELSKLNAVSADEEMITEANLKLKSGSVVGLNRKLPNPSEFKITTASGVVSMRGSECVVQSDGGVDCFSGDVSVQRNSSKKDGGDVLVPVGFSMNGDNGRVGTTSQNYAASFGHDFDAIREHEKGFKPPKCKPKHHHHMSPHDPDDDDDDDDHDHDGHGGHGDDGHGNDGHGNDGHGNDGHGNDGHGNDGHGNDHHDDDGHGNDNRGGRGD